MPDLLFFSELRAITFLNHREIVLTFRIMLDLLFIEVLF